MATQGSELFYYLFPTVIMAMAIVWYKRKAMGLIILFLLLFFSMFRGDKVGNDTMNYMNESRIGVLASAIDEMAYGVRDMGDSFGKQIQILYWGICWLVVVCDLPARSIIYLLSIIQMLFLFFALKRLKINIPIALSLYVLTGFYFYSLSAARQLASISVFIYGLTFIFDEGRKKYLFFLFTLVATSLHASALFYIWIYFLRYLKFNRKTLILIVGIICMINVVTTISVMDYVYRFVTIDYVSDYRGLYDSTTRESIVNRVTDFIRYVFLIYLFMIRNKEKKCDTFDVVFGIAMILWAMFSHTPGLLGRVTYFITVFIGIYMAKVFIDRNLLHNDLFMMRFSLFFITYFLSMRQWADSLMSGYYLMF